MNTKMRKLLTLSREEVDRLYHADGVSDREYRKYNLAWTWSCGRYSGRAEKIQDAFYASQGDRAFWRRVNRVRRACGLEPYPLYEETGTPKMNACRDLLEGRS